MITKTKVSHFVATVFWLGMAGTLAHHPEVHQEITKHAVESAADSFGSGYLGFLNVVGPDISIDDAAQALIIAAATEDDYYKDEGGFRSYNHFYDPLSGLGLANYPPDHWALPPFGPIGKNSFDWASIRNNPGLNFYGILPNLHFNKYFVPNFNTYNKWSWQNARDHQWDGLTKAAPTDRRAALENMFRAVGQVIHLLEDTSQPQHVRNEQHVPLGWNSPIEGYGKENRTTLNYQHAMLDWKAAGFTKMEDFWNRHLYIGNNASGLEADANNGAKLGLAEFSNGNFLGSRHLYPEYFKPGDVEYYPFPSRDKSTNYKQVKADPQIGIESYTLKYVGEVKGIYIKKTGDGIRDFHLSRINYLGAKVPQIARQLAPKSFCTIADDKILADYHSKLIPKAVEYSAGLLDYFFWGKLETTWTPKIDGTYDVEIKNVSRQDLKNGSFKLFYDNATDVRTELTGNDFVNPYSGALADNASITANVKAQDIPTKYTLVYKGIIGSSGGSAADSVDGDTAIAAKATTFPLDWADLQWADSVSQQSGSASGSASGASFSGSASATDGPEHYSYGDYEAEGALSYTGPATVCKLSLTGSHSTGLNSEGSFSFRVTVDGALVFVTSNNSGTFWFTIPESIDALVEVTFSVGTLVTHEGGINPNPTSASASASGTLSPHH